MSAQQSPLSLDAAPLTVCDIEQVARHARPVSLGPVATRKLSDSHNLLRSAIDSGATIYGVNTGFGSLSRQRISDADLKDVQRNLIRSHAAGVGDPLPDETVRAMLLLLVASLCRGCSGVRPVVAETITQLLNADITPIVPSIGSVGASGDLAPLAHAALVLIGEGRARVNGREADGAEALRAASIKPLELHAKEGLALINGTHLMAAQAALLLPDLDRLVDAALCACAMSIDACRGTDSFLDPRVHVARNQLGPARVAARLNTFLGAGGPGASEIIPSHAENDPRVQDPYSLRCAAPVLGAALDTIDHARRVIERELGAVTDNPLILAPTAEHTDIAVSAGNFHGMPIALPLDHVAVALTHVAGIAERRVFYMLAASDPEMHLRPYLSPVPGLHSGLMITQYTAAACVNELITLSTPASVSNIPTSAGMEDYNSFGPRAAAKARRALELTTHVVAIELLCAAEAIEHHRPLKSGHAI
ncbi:MAG TPA: histidine ammonia-lyase, partial [Phycisphaerales bacterium]|nr:histidine ammonia-lyase [Phycisphaerales bacterium]